MAAAAVAEAFGKAQTSAAQHRRCTLKLRRVQGSGLSPEFESAFQSALTHIAASNSTASSTKRLISFVASVCSEIDGQHNDTLGIVVLKVSNILRICSQRVHRSCADSSAVKRVQGSPCQSELLLNSGRGAKELVRYR